VENVLEASGDRFADIVEAVNLNGSIVHVLHYVENIVQNDKDDIEAQHCLKVLQSMAANAATAIGDAIE
jgi:hypothetical protein